MSAVDISRQRQTDEQNGQEAFPITAVVGPSWLNQLGLSFTESSMGRTGHLGPPPYKPVRDHEITPRVLGESIVVTGFDLYRLNCQGCHRADGSGFPPEINSLIGPVQATSPALIEGRMKRFGRMIDPDFSRELAGQGEADLRRRIKNGGKEMPPFRHLQSVEVDALVDYLKELADVPEAARKQVQLALPLSRVGEHVVKGTCHICHDATGPEFEPREWASKRIPALESFVREKSAFEVIRKVRVGAPASIDNRGKSYRGYMPVFDYLSNEDVAAAYLYLLLYPPCSH